jgi:citronellol/citronellal dehydrogenase
MTHAVATKAFIPSGHGGKVISVTLTPHTGLAGMAHSSAARSGVESLMRVLAIEWARFGVKLVSVAPGVVDTDTFDTKYPPAMVDALRGGTLAGRLVEPEDIARTIAFLATPGGDCISGSVINVDLAHDLRQSRWPDEASGDAGGHPLTEARSK